MNPLPTLTPALDAWPATRWAGAPPPPRVLTSLERCVLLAALLHVWLVLALGSAPAGTARPGQGVWGAINVTLRGVVTGRAAQAPPVAPVVPTGPAGDAPSARWGGAVRADRPPPLADPGAARIGTWAAQPQPTPAPQPAIAPVEPPVLAMLPGPQPPPRQVLPERGVQATPAEPTPAEPLPAPVVAERRLDSLPARPPAATAAAVPLPGVALLPNPTLAGSLPALTAPLAERAVPVAEPTPAAAPALRQLGASVAAPAARQAPLARDDALASAPAPQSLPAPSAPLAMPPAPDASSQLGHDVATAPSQAASSPRLNLDLPRLRGGELSRFSTTGVLPVLPRPPELPDKLGREIEKAAKADCRNAYSGLGVLAVVPLAVDAVRQGGCKW